MHLVLYEPLDGADVVCLCTKLCYEILQVSLAVFELLSASVQSGVSAFVQQLHAGDDHVKGSDILVAPLSGVAKALL